MKDSKRAILKGFWLIPAAMLSAAALVGCGHEAANGGKRAEDSPTRTIDDRGGYMRELGTFEGLDAETELRILQDYCKAWIEKEQAAHRAACIDSRGENWEEDLVYRESTAKVMEEIAQSYSVNNFWVTMHYGPSRGGAVVVIGSNLPRIGIDPVEEWYVAGIRFFCDILFHPPVMWKDGRFYGMQEAYDLSLLTREDLKSIADCVNVRRDE